MGRGVVFVTGASTGIGRATAERLARSGFDVIPGLRRPDSLPQPVKAAVQIDVADEASIERGCTEVLDRAGGQLVGVVNNAGASVTGPFETVAVDDWRAQFEVNFFGHLAVTKALLPALLGSRGRIINVGSIGGRFSVPFMAPYSASKFAMRAWTDALRLELGPHGVHAILIEPGAIDTAIWGKGNAAADEHLAGLDEEQQARYGRQVEGARRTATYAETHAIPADRCARVIERALTARRPRGRYLVGPDARVQALVSILPVRTMDRVTRVLLRQPRKV